MIRIAQIANNKLLTVDIFTRSKNNPILKPNPENSWGGFKVYNPGAIYEDGTYHLFYRAMGRDWISAIGNAISEDGENFTRADNKPALAPEFDYEKRGVEDCRVVKIDGIYLMAFVAFDGDIARLCLATSRDLNSWQKQGLILKKWDWTKSYNFLELFAEAIKRRFRLKRNWSKPGALFPEKINGKYWLLFGDTFMWHASSDDGISWMPSQAPLLKARKDFFDNNFIEVGPSPIKTKKGWLVLYHGVDKKLVYRLGFLILDINNPTNIIFRSPEPIFEPKEPYELRGIVDILPGGYKVMEKMNSDELAAFIQKYEAMGKMPRVAFVNGAVLVGDILHIYYGASDSVICTATAKLENILALV